MLNAVISNPLTEWLDLHSLLRTAEGMKEQGRRRKKRARAGPSRPSRFSVSMRHFKSVTLGVMRRKCGCKFQPAHCDSAPGGSFLECDPHDIGMAVIIGLGSTIIHVYPFDEPSLKSSAIPVQVLCGDVLLLRGDCGHFGDENGGTEDTLIIHGYIDSPVEGCQRELDKLTGEALTFEFHGYPWQS